MWCGCSCSRSSTGGVAVAATKPAAVILKSVLALTCPNCGKGKLYQGMLRVRDKCPTCKADLSAFNAEDGPALFAIVILSAMAIGLMAFLELNFHPPLWVYMVAYPLPMLALTVLLIRHIKAFLLASAWVHGIKNKK